MTAAKTAFAGGVNPFTVLPTCDEAFMAASISISSNAGCMLYPLIDLLALHQKWVDSGRIGRQPLAKCPPELTKSIGHFMNAAAKNYSLKERVTWNKNRGEIWLKTRPSLG